MPDHLTRIIAACLGSAVIVTLVLGCAQPQSTAAAVRVAPGPEGAVPDELTECLQPRSTPAALQKPPASERKLLDQLILDLVLLQDDLELSETLKGERTYHGYPPTGYGFIINKRVISLGDRISRVREERRIQNPALLREFRSEIEVPFRAVERAWRDRHPGMDDPEYE
jgi:hypothetical protein